MGFVKAQVDFVGFNRAMVALQAMTGQSMKQVVRSESAAILSDCAKNTKVAKKDVVERKSRLRVLQRDGLTQATIPGDVTINSGWRKNAPYGRVWLKVRPGGKKSFVLARGPNFGPPVGSATAGQAGPWAQEVASESAKALSQFPAEIAKGFASIGLARKSWIQIAESMRLDLTGLAEGEDAMAARALYNNGASREQMGRGIFQATLINLLPYGRRMGLPSVIARAINRRTQTFAKNMKRGVFQDAEKVLAKYPGMFVKY